MKGTEDNTMTAAGFAAAAAGRPGSGTGPDRVSQRQPGRPGMRGLRRGQPHRSRVGAGHVAGPVTEAAANNPLLTTLTSALSGQLNPQVNLVDTLNSGQYTVFAPTDAAFGKLPPATIEQLKTDSGLLTSILTYHVVSGQASPNRVDRHPQDAAGRQRDGRPGRATTSGSTTPTWSAAASRRPTRRST